MLSVLYTLFFIFLTLLFLGKCSFIRRNINMLLKVVVIVSIIIMINDLFSVGYRSWKSQNL